MQRNTRLLALLGLVALTGCGLGSSSTSYTLSGTVTQGRAQEAVAGATVSADGAITTSDASGKFSISTGGTVSNLTVSKSGYASSSIQNLNTGDLSNVDAILLPVYDAALPTTPPSVKVTGIDDGATVGDQDVTLTIAYTTTDPTENPIKEGIVTLEVPGGSSGTLNLGRVRAFFGSPRLTQDTVTITKANLAAFKGDVDVHITVYDLNGNRTDLIKHVKVTPAANSAAVVAPGNVSPLAVTWGDNLTFGAYDVTPQAGDATPQAAPTGKSLWTDINFTYPVASAAPRAFELWRSLDGSNFDKVYSVAPGAAVLDKTKGTYRMRDVSGLLTPGVKTYYKVRAVSDAGSADSDVQDVTPLGAFDVKLLSPAQASTGADRAPIFRWSATGASDITHYAVIVLDRVEANGQSTAWSSNEILNDTSAVYNFDGTAPLAKLQPYHAYEWQLAAYTQSKDKKAVAIAADYFNLFGLAPVSSAPMKSGPISEFVTGGL